jgi:hypothetical protein
MTTANDLFETRSPFSMEGIEMSRRARDNELKVTVSVRAGEWLDRTGEILIYYDALLASDQSFVVQGLTRNELAAEKLLGWCSKPLSKHFVDLAYVAREHHEHIDQERVADLIIRKFSIEGEAPRYRNAGIHRPADLVAQFTDPAKLAELRTDWERFTETELLLLPQERSAAAEVTLLDVANVERQAVEFWQPTLERLAA